MKTITQAEYRLNSNCWAAQREIVREEENVSRLVRGIENMKEELQRAELHLAMLKEAEEEFREVITKHYGGMIVFPTEGQSINFEQLTRSTSEPLPSEH